MKEEKNGAKMIASELLGIKGETILVNGKVYFLKPPTIRQIVGAGIYLTEFGDEKTLAEHLAKTESLGGLCKALSIFIQGDEGLEDKLSKGTLSEVLQGLEMAISLLDIKNFQKLSALGKSVRMLIAKPK